MLAANHRTPSETRLRVSRLLPITSRMNIAKPNGNTAVGTRAGGLRSGTIFPAHDRSVLVDATGINTPSVMVPLLPVSFQNFLRCGIMVGKGRHGFRRATQIVGGYRHRDRRVRPPAPLRRQSLHGAMPLPQREERPPSPSTSSTSSTSASPAAPAAMSSNSCRRTKASASTRPSNRWPSATAFPCPSAPGMPTRTPNCAARCSPCTNSPRRISAPTSHAGRAKRRAYLAKRGVAPATVEQFGLGYSDRSGRALRPPLRTARLPGRADGNPAWSASARTAASTTASATGSCSPSTTRAGKIIGFGGRALSSNDEPKYLNSPETPIYKKSHVLYNLHRAKEGRPQERTA